MGTSAGGLFSGEVFFGDAPNSKSFFSVGETDKFEVATPSDKKSLTSKKPSAYGNASSTVYIPQEITCGMTLKTFNRGNLELAFRGTASTINQAAASITDAEIVVKLGQYNFFEFRNLSNVIVTSQDELTTYTEGTDYSVDSDHGFVQFLLAGIIPDGDTIKISYDYAASMGYKVDAATKNSIEVPVMLIGNNLATGERIRVFLPSVVMTPSGGTDFLADDFVPIELEGVPQTGPNKEAPFSFTLIN